MGFFEFIKNNLGHAGPLLLLGAFGLAIVAERTRALFTVYPVKDLDGFFDRVQDLVMAGKLGEAITLCDKYPQKTTAQVTKQALLRAHQPENLIEQGVELSVGSSIQKVQKRTSFLATIANVATLLGLFGTIIGLIHSFEAVGHADAQQKSALLANGIATAMNATMLGLGIAIPCMMAFSFLMNRSNRLVADIDHTAVRVLDILKQRYYAAESEALNPRNPGRAGDDDEDADAHFNGKGKVTSLRRSA
jgi:biopolymer transport protein ExbB/TolQ